jgi:hypothetical protein
MISLILPPLSNSAFIFTFRVTAFPCGKLLVIDWAQNAIIKKKGKGKSGNIKGGRGKIFHIPKKAVPIKSISVLCLSCYALNLLTLLELEDFSLARLGFRSDNFCHLAEL